MSDILVISFVLGVISAYALVVGVYRGVIGEERWDGDPLWSVAGIFWPITVVVAPAVLLGMAIVRGGSGLGRLIARRFTRPKLPRAEVHRGR